MSTPTIKIFGREPAFYVGVIEALIAVLVTFKLPGLSVEQAGYVVALVVAVGGAVTAWATRDTLLAALVGAVKAGLVLAVSYGLTVTDEQIGLIAALVSVIGSGYLRSQTSPVETAVSSSRRGFASGGLIVGPVPPVQRGASPDYLSPRKH